MTSRERMQAVFAGQPTDVPAVVVHGYGFYKSQFAGLARGFEDQSRCLAMTVRERAEVESGLYERPTDFFVGHDPQTARPRQALKRRLK